MKKLLIYLVLSVASQALEIPEICKSYEGREQMFCIAITIQENNIKVLETQNKLLKDQTKLMQELLFIKKGI